MTIIDDDDGVNNNIKISSVMGAFRAKHVRPRTVNIHARPRSRTVWRPRAGRPPTQSGTATVRNASGVLRAASGHGHRRPVGGKTYVLLQPNDVAVAGVSVPAADGQAVTAVRCRDGIIAGRRRRSCGVPFLSGRSPPGKRTRKNEHTRK